MPVSGGSSTLNAGRNIPHPGQGTDPGAADREDTDSRPMGGNDNTCAGLLRNPSGGARYSFSAGVREAWRYGGGKSIGTSVRPWFACGMRITGGQAARRILRVPKGMDVRP